MDAELEKIFEKAKKAVKSQSEDLCKSMPCGEPTRFDEVNTLNTVQRIDIAKNIISRYSMLKKQKGILHEQIFSAMEDYLSECGIAGVIDLAQSRLLKLKQ